MTACSSSARRCSAARQVLPDAGIGCEFEGGGQKFVHRAISRSGGCTGLAEVYREGGGGSNPLAPTHQPQQHWALAGFAPLIGPHLLPLVAKPGDKALAAPQFNVAAIDQAPGPLDRLGIVGAHQRLERDETAIEPDGISPIIHPCTRRHASGGRGFVAFETREVRISRASSPTTK
jgi:hypothetical protein